jgi:hypothetical protein
LAQAPFISLTYATDIYLCPYSKGVTDINNNFQGCSLTNPTQGYPCLTNDKITNYCTQCANPYSANELGVCMLNMNCGPSQYWHFGSCHDVIANCKYFDQIGGLCSKCISGYNLTNLVNGSQHCDRLA